MPTETRSKTCGVTDADNDVTTISTSSVQGDRRSSTFRSSSQQNVYPTLEQDNVDGLSNLDQQTLKLVEQFKSKISGKIKSNNVERMIELEVANIRRKQNPSTLDVVKWERSIRSEINDCPKAVLTRSMAYGNNPDEVKSILQAKIKEYESNPYEYENEEPTDTSLDQIIDPLQKLHDKVNNQSSFNLFQAVLDVKDNEIDRADRMFFSEARRFMKDPLNYTYDMAHYQVQAIRLMNYEIGDKDDLRYLANHCPNFDKAYEYLKERTKEMKGSGINQKQSNTKPTRKSIIQDDANVDDNEKYGYDPPLTNSAQSSSTNARSPGRQSIPSDNKGIQSTDDNNRPYSSHRRK